MIFSLESIDWRGFLARPLLSAPAVEILEQIGTERILITGAGGSIGSALALRIAFLAPRELVLMENAESQLFALQNRLREAAPAVSPRHVLGSVLDRGLVDEICDRYRPTLIFHAAAYKHVPLLEEQPLAAITNNVFGTEVLVSVAAASQARLVLLSTDKGVEPASILGATKRVAERIVLGSAGTALRLGNVLASSGSVAETFAAQIAAGGPVTVTDPAARRYFLTLDEAVGLLLSAARERAASSLFAPDLGSQHFIADLAHFMAETLAPGGAIELVFTAPRCGDKESEKLWGVDERASCCEAPGLLSIRSREDDSVERKRGLVALHEAVDARDIQSALAALQSLVPEYTPSAAVLALAERDASRAAL